MGLPVKSDFNPDPSKKAQEVTFSENTNKQYHPLLAIITMYQ